MRLDIFKANTPSATPFHRQTCWKSAATVKPGGNVKNTIGALHLSNFHNLIIQAGSCGLVPAAKAETLQREMICFSELSIGSISLLRNERSIQSMQGRPLGDGEQVASHG
jgi:hypothetical protein